MKRLNVATFVIIMIMVACGCSDYHVKLATAICPVLPLAFDKKSQCDYYAVTQDRDTIKVQLSAGNYYNHKTPIPGVITCYDNGKKIFIPFYHSTNSTFIPAVIRSHNKHKIYSFFTDKVEYACYASFLNGDSIEVSVPKNEYESSKIPIIGHVSMIGEFGRTKIFHPIVKY